MKSYVTPLFVVLCMVVSAAPDSAATAATNAAKSAEAASLPSDVVVRDRGREWRFVEVDGTSRLPLEFMHTGEDESKLESVKFPRFWIARTPVSEDDFAEFFGRKVHPSRNGTAPVTEIEWDEARAFCDWFTRKHRALLPKNCIASFPSAMEWAHAVRVLDGRVNLSADAGTFLFTGSAFGGYLRTLGRGSEAKDCGFGENAALAWRLALIPKRVRAEDVGLRLVLVDVASAYDGDNQTVLRGMVLLQKGDLVSAKRYFRLAREQGVLSADDRAFVEKALAYEEARRAFEDWSGLVALSARTAAMRGFETAPFCREWQWGGLVAAEDSKVADAYRRRGIVGEWRRIGDLPLDVRRGQSALGEERSFFIEADNMKASFTVGTNTLVQVMACDFTGDGRGDMVVEQFGAVGSLGYWYDFYRQLPDGVYTNVYSLQTVGLCALPKKDGKGCGFISVGKESNPVLFTQLLEWRDGEMVESKAYEKPFYMLDAREEAVYMPAPFIGGGYGVG